MPTPNKSMAELQAMTKLELIQLVVERAVALQSLESKCKLLEHTQADAVNHAFLGLLKRLGIKPDRDNLTEDDMHRLITSNLLGWEFPSEAEVACLLTEAERVRALGPRPDYICGICGKPIDRCQAAWDHDVTIVCRSCGPTPHRYRPSPEAGPYWRCSECGEAASTSSVCRATSVQDCCHCDDKDCGDNTSSTVNQRSHHIGPRQGYVCSICGKPIDRCQAACSIEASIGSPDHIEFHQECWDAEYGPWPPTEQMMRAAQSRHRRNH